MNGHTQQLTSAPLVKKMDDRTVVVARRLHQGGINPTLAVVAVGAAAESVFVRLKKRRGRELGVEVSVYQLPATAPASEIAATIDWLNKDADTHGIIIQLPLPARLSNEETTELLRRVAAAKDVDALGRGRSITKSDNLTELERAACRRGRFLPTTALAMLLLCRHHRLNLKRGVLIVGRGRLVGRPLTQMLRALQVKVKTVGRTSPDRDRQIMAAQVILTGTDSQHPILNHTFVTPETAVVAAGAEIDYATLDGYARALTPKVGGVGPLTISLLIRNTVTACQQQLKHSRA